MLIALLLLALAPPFVAQAQGSVVGSYTMFHQLSLYHLDLTAVFGEERHRVELRTLAPHLSPEASVILMPAGGRAVGADQIDVVAASLPDLARLVCALHPGADRGSARLSQDPFDATRVTQRAAEVPCPSRR
jgi:hypothetical protein